MGIMPGYGPEEFRRRLRVAGSGLAIGAVFGAALNFAVALLVNWPLLATLWALAFAGSLGLVRWQFSAGQRLKRQPTRIDMETGERLATERERAEARAEAESRTWGLYARIR